MPPLIHTPNKIQSLICKSSGKHSVAPPPRMAEIDAPNSHHLNYITFDELRPGRPTHNIVCHLLRFWDSSNSNIINDAAFTGIVFLLLDEKVTHSSQLFHKLIHFILKLPMELVFSLVFPNKLRIIFSLLKFIILSSSIIFFPELCHPWLHTTCPNSPVPQSVRRRF